MKRPRQKPKMGAFGRIFVFAVLGGAFISVGIGAASTRDGPIGYWPLNNPTGVQKMVITFGMLNAGNDWSRAIDTVRAGGLAEERVIALAEDFEGLALGPSPEEAPGTQGVWTDTPPAGWIVDDSGVPGVGDPATDGVTDWAGWAFADKDFWISSDYQRREEFELGQGTVAVADPDEWDDAPHAGGYYNTYLTTPAIDISDFGAGTVQLKFDSSWRPEFDSYYHQTANLTVSFDGADPIELFRWESDSSSPNYKPDATNETVVLDLDNPPGAQGMVLTFGLFDAGNDWWWAIDNVEVSGLHRNRVIVLLSDANTVVEEGGPTDSYEIILNSEPTADVRITATPDDGQIDLGSGPGEPAVLDFTTGSWNTPQIVHVTAFNDDVYEGKIPHTTTIAHTAVSEDEDYDGIGIASVEVSVVDNELTCGDWGYLRSDLNKDCYVNFVDFALFADLWVER